MTPLLAICLSIAAVQEKGAHAPAHPRDPWVFRCVLDKHPRMVTIALSDEMWVAYDATTCSLYKAWKGGVHFDGPVYTTVHGPQPTTKGTAYIEAVDGDAWEVRVGTEMHPVSARWKGYRFNGDHVALEYDLPLPDGRSLPVLESPEFATPELVFDAQKVDAIGRGRPGFLRSYFARNLPEDVEVALRLRTGAGKAILDQPEVRGEGDALRIVMNAKKPQASVMLFFDPIPDVSKTEEKK